MTLEGRTGQIRLALLSIPLLLGSLYPLQRRIDRTIKPLQLKQDELLVTSGTLLKKLSLGYDSLLADIYWTRAVQYYGRRVGKKKVDYAQLAPLLNVTTTLDPHLMIAIRFGATFLAEEPPVGAGRPDLAADLVRRGIAANPNEWRLYSDLGTILYWHAKDYHAAAQAFWKGGDVPGAPPWMKAFAAHVEQEGKSRSTSRFMWAEVYKSTTDVRIRNNALNHLTELQAEDEIDQLGQIAAAYQKKFGHVPASIAELISAGLLKSVPNDPEGYPYRLGNDGKAIVDPASPLAPLIEKYAAND